MPAIVPPGQLAPLDLGLELGHLRGRPPVPSLTCQHPQCPVAGVRGMPSVLVPTPGRALIQHISRLQQAQPHQQQGLNLQPWELPLYRPAGQPGPLVPTIKLLTPVARPPANHPEYPGLEPRVILCNSPGHWVAFVEVGGHWYRTDGVAVQQVDPWVGQCDPAQGPGGYTIDVILLAQ